MNVKGSTAIYISMYFRFEQNRPGLKLHLPDLLSVPVLMKRFYEKEYFETEHAYINHIRFFC